MVHDDPLDAAGRPVQVAAVRRQSRPDVHALRPEDGLDRVPEILRRRWSWRRCYRPGERFGLREGAGAQHDLPDQIFVAHVEPDPRIRAPVIRERHDLLHPAVVPTLLPVPVQLVDEPVRPFGHLTGQVRPAAVILAGDARVDAALRDEDRHMLRALQEPPRPPLPVLLWAIQGPVFVQPQVVALGHSGEHRGEG